VLSVAIAGALSTVIPSRDDAVDGSGRELLRLAATVDSAARDGTLISELICTLPPVTSTLTDDTSTLAAVEIRD